MWGYGRYRYHVETAGNVIGQHGLLVRAAFSYMFLMQVEVVDSEYNIKEAEGYSVSCCFSVTTSN